MLQDFFKQARGNERAREKQRNRINVLKRIMEPNKLVLVYDLLAAFYKRAEDGSLAETPVTKYLDDFFSTLSQITPDGKLLRDMVLPISRKDIYSIDWPQVQEMRQRYERLFEKAIKIQEDKVYNTTSGVIIGERVTLTRGFFVMPLQAAMEYWDSDSDRDNLDVISEALIQSGKGEEAIAFWERLISTRDYSDIYKHYPQIFDTSNRHVVVKEDADRVRVPGWSPAPSPIKI